MHEPPPNGDDLDTTSKVEVPDLPVVETNVFSPMGQVESFGRFAEGTASRFGTHRVTRAFQIALVVGIALALLALAL